MGRRAIQFAVLLAAILASAARAHAEDDGSEQLLEAFDALRTQIQAPSPESQVSCQTFSDYSKKTRSCAYADFCGFLAQNGDRPYLYESPKGGRIPNFALKGFDQSLASCYASVADRIVRRNSAQKSSGYLAALRDRRAAAIRRHQAFLQSVRDRGEQEIWLRIEAAAVDRSLSEALSDPNPGASPSPAPSSLGPHATLEAFVEKQMADLEKSAGSSFSPETRALWKADLVGSLEPTPSFPSFEAKAWRSLVENPFLDPGRFLDEKAAGGADALKANRALAEKEIARVKGVFDETRSAVIAFLGKRRTARNSAAIDSMIERVKKVIYFPKLENTGSCAVPNAYFEKQEMRVVLCPQLMEAPASSLKAVFAHEIAHSIDPCRAGGALYAEPASGAGEAATGLPWLSAGFEKRKERLIWLKDGESPAPGSPAVAISLGVEEARNPFAKELSCLSSKESLGARKPSKKEIERMLDLAVAELKATGIRQEDSTQLQSLLKARESLDRHYEKVAYCPDYLSLESPQLAEAFSDWVMNEVVAAGSEGKAPAEKRDSLFESFAFQLMNACAGQISSSSLESRKKLFRQAGCEKEDPASLIRGLRTAEQWKEQWSRNFHPTHPARINRLSLAHPSIAKALGCKPPKGVRYCE